MVHTSETSGSEAKRALVEAIVDMADEYKTIFLTGKDVELEMKRRWQALVEACLAAA